MDDIPVNNPEMAKSMSVNRDGQACGVPESIDINENPVSYGSHSFEISSDSQNRQMETARGKEMSVVLAMNINYQPCSHEKQDSCCSRLEGQQRISAIRDIENKSPFVYR